MSLCLTRAIRRSTVSENQQLTVLKCVQKSGSLLFLRRAFPMNFSQVFGVLYPVRGIRRNRTATAMIVGLAGWCILLALFSGAGAVHAQNTNATIRGQVLDQSGALVPAAQVLIVNQDTGVTVFTARSDPPGPFPAPPIIPRTHPLTL